MNRQHEHEHRFLRRERGDTFSEASCFSPKRPKLPSPRITWTDIIIIIVVIIIIRILRMTISQQPTTGSKYSYSSPPRPSSTRYNYLSNIYATPRVTYDYRGHPLSFTHGVPDPVVMAYPSADGFFIAVCEQVDQRLLNNRPGSCCSSDVIVKRPNYFRHYPTTAVAADKVNSEDAITEIASGSLCQDLCFR